MSRPSKKLRLVLRVMVAMVVLFFILRAAARGLEEVGASGLPSLATSLISISAGLGTLLAYATAWGALLGVRIGEPGFLVGVIASQTARYVPGAVWQPITQVAWARGSQSRGRAAMALPVSLVIAVVAALTVGSFLGLSSHLGVATRLLVGSGAVSAVLLDRRWMIRASRVVFRVLRREFEPNIIPSQPSILLAFGWSVVGFLLHGIVFALVLPLSSSRLHAGVATAAFAVAWAAGFLAVPVPAGLGVREGVLALLLGGVTTPAVVVLGAVLHRLVILIAEVSLLVLLAVSNARKIRRSEHRIEGGDGADEVHISNGQSSPPDRHEQASQDD